MTRIWTQHILVNLGARWNEEGQGKEEVFKVTPEFLACLTGEVSVPFSNWGALERGCVCEAAPKSSAEIHQNGYREENDCMLRCGVQSEKLQRLVRSS